MTVLDLGAVSVELESKLRAELPALRVAKWGDQIQAPGAAFLLPEGQSRTTYRSWKIDGAQLLILVGKAVNRVALTNVYLYAAQAADMIDTSRWTSCSDITVERVTYETVTQAGQPDAFLGAFLHLDIQG